MESRRAFNNAVSRNRPWTYCGNSHKDFKKMTSWTQSLFLRHVINCMIQSLRNSILGRYFLARSNVRIYMCLWVFESIIVFLLSESMIDTTDLCQQRRKLILIIHCVTRCATSRKLLFNLHDNLMKSICFMDKLKLRRNLSNLSSQMGEHLVNTLAASGAHLCFYTISTFDFLEIKALQRYFYRHGAHIVHEL